MSTTYATIEDLTARLSSAYPVPVDPYASQLLDKASELIDFVTQGKAELAWNAVVQEDPNGLFTWTQDQIDAQKALITHATCDQVEFWYEAGEAFDIAGLSGALIAGRLQVSKLPNRIGSRARQQLMRANLYWAGTFAQ